MNFETLQSESFWEAFKEDRMDLKIDTLAIMTRLVSLWSNSSTKKVGCLIVNRTFRKIAAFGYNGSYAGAPINETTGTEEESLEPGQSGFLHAELNAVAKFREHDPENYVVILTLSPCKQCAKLLINAGFKHVYWIDQYRENDHLSIFDHAKVCCGTIETLKSNIGSIRVQ